MIGRITRRPELVDIAVVGGLIAIDVAGTWLPVLEGPSGSAAPRDVLSTATAILVILPLAWRRRYPTAVMAVTGALYFARIGFGFPITNGLGLAQLIAVYSVGTYERRPLADRVRPVFGAVVAVAFLTSAVAGFVSLTMAVTSMATWAAAALFGEAVWLRGRYQETLEEWARRAEAEQAERDRRSVQDERARIAREFHDIWAHTLSVVVVQAEAAEEIFDESPEMARQALGRIRRAGREALTEVRRLIATDMDSPGSERLGTLPTLADLGALAEDLRASGLAVSLSVSGRIDGLPNDVNLSGYRVVQQALTNSLTHGGPGVSAWVDVVASDGDVRIDVVDNGRGAADQPRPAREGRGLIGMRERVMLVGGELHAGPEPHGGFGVHARIPLPVDR